jgi:hypothetical protein
VCIYLHSLIKPLSFSAVFEFFRSTSLTLSFLCAAAINSSCSSTSLLLRLRCASCITISCIIMIIIIIRCLLLLRLTRLSCCFLCSRLCLCLGSSCSRFLWLSFSFRFAFNKCFIILVLTAMYIADKMCSD